MKILLPLSSDYILKTKFQINYIKTDTGKVADWVDEKKQQANGKNIVDSITILTPIYNSEGYATDKLQMTSIDKTDIILLLDKINEIESLAVVSTPEDDLPF